MESHPEFERLKSTVLSFASSEKAGAMLVHGPWGVGKTYAVLEALKANSESDQIPFSYVSLYGISTLDDIYLRLAVGWMNKVTKKIPTWLAARIDGVNGQTAGAITSTVQNIAGFLFGKQRIDALTASLASTTGLLANKAVVVIDDLERKAPIFSIHSVLGVVSYLVEARECRVIVITNDDQIEGPEKKVFDGHKEKVFDFEVAYSPTVEQNAAIFAGNYDNYLRPTLLALGIKNLRVIRRTARILELINAKLPSNYTLAKQSILTSATQICALYLGFREKVDLSKLKDTSSLQVALYYESNNDNNNTLSEGDTLILKSGFSSGPCDELLIEVVKTGETDWHQFQELAKELQDHHEEIVANSVFERELRALFENFSRNDEDINRVIKQKCDDTLILLRPGTIDWAGQILVDMGEEDYREGWFEKWAQANIRKVPDNEIRLVLDGIESVPKLLKDKYKEEAERRRPPLDIGKVLFARYSGQLFSSGQIDRISELPHEQFVSWIRQSKSDDLRGIIREIFKESYGREGAEGIIAQKTLQAVDELAKESPLNALRAKYLKSALPSVNNLKQEN